MRLRWSDRAGAELKDIGRYIRRDNPEAARKWVARLRQRARAAARSPLAGRVVPEFGRDEIREVLLGNYRIVYRVEEKALTVLTVFEGHRLLRTGVTP